MLILFSFIEYVILQHYKNELYIWCFLKMLYSSQLISFHWIIGNRYFSLDNADSWLFYVRNINQKFVSNQNFYKKEMPISWQLTNVQWLILQRYIAIVRKQSLFWLCHSILRLFCIKPLEISKTCKIKSF